MARIKIDYGIDLGTTNSAIARMENGESVIKQTKTLWTHCLLVFISQRIKGGTCLAYWHESKGFCVF